MNKKPIRMFFDESGSIPKTRLDKFFVVACVLPISNNNMIKNRFKRWKKNYTARNNIDIKKEVKGSYMNDTDIKFFVNYLKDNLKIIYAFFNAKEIKNAEWLRNSKLTHNYLIWLVTEKAIEIEKHSNMNITMEIDIMNNPSKGMNSLEDYINSKLLFDKDTNNKTKIKYLDSKDSWAIQVADIFSNFIYRNIKSNTMENLYSMPEFLKEEFINLFYGCCIIMIDVNPMVVGFPKRMLSTQLYRWSFFILLVLDKSYKEKFEPSRTFAIYHLGSMRSFDFKIV